MTGHPQWTLRPSVVTVQSTTLFEQAESNDLYSMLRSTLKYYIHWILHLVSLRVLHGCREFHCKVSHEHYRMLWTRVLPPYILTTFFFCSFPARSFSFETLQKNSWDSFERCFWNSEQVVTNAIKLVVVPSFIFSTFIPKPHVLHTSRHFLPPCSLRWREFSLR